MASRAHLRASSSLLQPHVMTLRYPACIIEKAMTLVLRPATDDDVREFAAWQYETPYDVYNIAMSLDDAVAYFVDPAVRCYSLIDGSEVVGYCTCLLYTSPSPR